MIFSFLLLLLLPHNRELQCQAQQQFDKHKTCRDDDKVSLEKKGRKYKNYFHISNQAELFSNCFVIKLMCSEFLRGKKKFSSLERSNTRRCLKTIFEYSSAFFRLRLHFQFERKASSEMYASYVPGDLFSFTRFFMALCEGSLRILRAGEDEKRFHFHGAFFCVR